MSTELATIVGPQAQKSVIQITKATVKKQLLAAEFTEQLDLESKPREFTMQGTEPVHPDLEQAFARLVPHFCLLTEQLEEGPNYWPAEDRDDLPAGFDNYGVTGIIAGAKGGVTLMGFRKLENGKVLNMTAQYVSFADPSEQFEESDAWRYPHTEALEQLMEYVLDEVEAALRGKCSEVGRQLKMFSQEPEQQVITELPGETAQDLPAEQAQAKPERKPRAPRKARQVVAEDAA